MRACTHTQAHTHTHTYTHTYTHKHTHTHKQANTHTHKQAKQRVGMDTQLSAEAASLSRIAAAKAVNGGNESNSCLEGKVVKNEWQTTKGRQDECGVVPADL